LGFYRFINYDDSVKVKNTRVGPLIKEFVEKAVEDGYSKYLKKALKAILKA